MSDKTFRVFLVAILATASILVGSLVEWRAAVKETARYRICIEGGNSPEICEVGRD